MSNKGASFQKKYRVNHIPAPPHGQETLRREATQEERIAHTYKLTLHLAYLSTRLVSQWLYPRDINEMQRSGSTSLLRHAYAATFLKRKKKKGQKLCINEKQREPF